MNILFVSFAITAALLSPWIHAEDACPKSISVNQTIPASEESKIEYFVEPGDKNNTLVGVELFLGHPSNKGHQMPDDEKISSGKKTVSFIFGDSSKFGGTFLLCRYANTYYTVVVDLGKKKKCDLVYSTTQFYPNRMNVFEKIFCE